MININQNVMSLWRLEKSLIEANSLKPIVEDGRHSRRPKQEEILP